MELTGGKFFRALSRAAVIRKRQNGAWDDAGAGMFVEVPMDSTMKSLPAWPKDSLNHAEICPSGTAGKGIALIQDSGLYQLPLIPLIKCNVIN